MALSLAFSLVDSNPPATVNVGSTGFAGSSVRGARDTLAGGALPLPDLTAGLTAFGLSSSPTTTNCPNAGPWAAARATAAATTTAVSKRVMGKAPLGVRLWLIAKPQAARRSGVFQPAALRLGRRGRGPRADHLHHPG